VEPPEPGPPPINLLDDPGAFLPSDLLLRARREFGSWVVARHDQVTVAVGVAAGRGSSAQILARAAIAVITAATHMIPPSQRPSLEVVAVLAPLDAPKAWPAPGVAPGPEHLNSGVCWPPAGPGPRRIARILVFRAQEALKVLLHEALHAASWPVPLDLTGIMDRGAGAVAARHGLRPAPGSRLGIEEALVEAMATAGICWAIALSEKAGSRAKGGATAEGRRAARLLEVEAEHAARNARRLTAPLSPRALEAERTHAFAYVVAKAALLAHAPHEFLRPTTSLAGQRGADEWRGIALRALESAGDTLAPRAPGPASDRTRPFRHAHLELLPGHILTLIPRMKGA
jgi:hypothetical protein